MAAHTVRAAPGQLAGDRPQAAALLRMILVLSDGRQAAALRLRMRIIVRHSGPGRPGNLENDSRSQGAELGRALRMILYSQTAMGIVDSTFVLVNYPKPTSFRYRPKPTPCKN
jgi:hypothetical protein